MNNFRIVLAEQIANARKQGQTDQQIIELLFECSCDQADKLSRRNMQIKDLKIQVNSNITAKDNLHSRIDVLEKIVKDNNLWETYCIACDNNR